MFPLLREGESKTPTFHMFNERTLRLMKATAFLINTRAARGLMKLPGKSSERKMDWRSCAGCVCAGTLRRIPRCAIGD